MVFSQTGLILCEIVKSSVIYNINPNRRGVIEVGFDYLLQFARQISGGLSQCWLFVTVARQIVGFFSQCWLFVTVCILNKLLEVYPNLNFLLQFARQIAGGLS